MAGVGGPSAEVGVAEFDRGAFAGDGTMFGPDSVLWVPWRKEDQPCMFDLAIDIGVSNAAMLDKVRYL